MAYVQSQVRAAIAANGWYTDFVHWHSVYDRTPAGPMDARYFDTLRHRVERYGTEHFPQIGNERLYGELIVTLNVNQRGGLGYHKDGWNVAGVEVTRSSGNRDLDRRAVAIVQASAPFGDFSPEMRQRYDILEIVTRMTFSRQGVQAETLASPSVAAAR